MIPKQNNWIPLTKKIIQTVLGQPDTGSPNISVLQIITIIMINEIMQNNIPAIEDINKGTVEKPIMLSIE